MPKVSVIIPVYNVRERIVECLDSVLAQTLDDVEVVLVDDHGPDDSMAVIRQHLESYAGPKSFVYAETLVNAGPGAARNAGIRAAGGEYVAFLDGDDTLDPCFCQALYEAARKVDADLAFCHISFDMPDGSSVVKHNPAVTPGPFEGAAKRRYLRRFTSYFTTYLYRRMLLEDYDIAFPGTHSAEDSCFLISSLLVARRIASVDRALYHYAIQHDSVSRKRDPQRWKNRLASLRRMVAFAREKGCYRPYRGVIRLLVFKKGWLMSATDYFKNNLF